MKGKILRKVVLSMFVISNTILFGLAPGTMESESPVLDGFLDEHFWSSAQSFNEFVQYFPVVGANPEDSTNVMVKRDTDNLYIAFKVFSDKNLTTFANVMERDQELTNDDYVEVIIDTYNNNTDALSFQTNMLGTRFDREFSENVTVTNKSWNTLWDVKTMITEYGWNAEFRIPFASLRYEESENAVMGFKFLRQIVARNMIVVFPLKEINVDNALYNLNFAEKISLGTLKTKRRILFSPYIVNNIVHQYSLNNTGNAYSSNFEFSKSKNFFKNQAFDRLLSNVGIDIKYKLNSSNTLDLTLNTNYAQAEAEDRIINITRYSILLPEKRQFFLENENLFSGAMFGHRMFNSINIGTENGKQVPIIGGFRLSGLSGGYQYGLLNMQSSGVASEDISAKNFTVARVTKNIKNDESYLGGYATHKESTESSKNNTVIGVDGIIRFNNSFVANGFIATSRNNGNNIKDSNSFGLALNRFPQDGIALSLRFREYQNNFNPGLGFLPRPDTRRLTSRVGYRFRFNEGLITRFIIGNYNSFFYISSNDQKQFTQHNMYYLMNFRNGSFLLFYLPMYQKDYLYNDWNFTDNINIPNGQYEMFTYHADYRSGNSNIYNYSVYSVYGDFYGGKKFSSRGDINYILSSRFNAGFSYDYNHIQFPDTFAKNGSANQSVALFAAKLKYNFSSSASLNAYIQYDNLSNTLGSNIRFRYNVSEGSDFYLVYNQLVNTSRLNYSPNKPVLQNQILILKYTHLFNFN